MSTASRAAYGAAARRREWEEEMILQNAERVQSILEGIDRLCEVQVESLEVQRQILSRLTCGHLVPEDAIAENQTKAGG